MIDDAHALGLGQQSGEQRNQLVLLQGRCRIVHAGQQVGESELIGQAHLRLHFLEPLPHVIAGMILPAHKQAESQIAHPVILLPF